MILRLTTRRKPRVKGCPHEVKQAGQLVAVRAQAERWAALTPHDDCIRDAVLADAGRTILTLIDQATKENQ